MKLDYIIIHMDNYDVAKGYECVTAEYEIVSVVGSGAHGQVVKAKCRQTGRFAAIKKIKNAFANPLKTR